MTEPAILGQKTIHKGALHGMAEAKVTLPFKNSPFYLDVTPINENFCLIELKTKGIDNPIKYSYTPRPKIIKKVVKNYTIKGKNLLAKEDNISEAAEEKLEI